MTLDDMEKRLEELIAQNKKEEAVRLLYQMVVHCAKSKAFQKAEDYRARIMDIDSMALSQIVGAAEIIESEKTKSIDLEHRNVWHDLYGDMTDEEANDLYFSLKKIKLPSGKVILQQGRVNNRLFLIDSGMLRIICTQGKKEIFLKKVVKGEPVGQKCFFDITYATVTAITDGPVAMHYLERDAFNRIVEKHPGIDARIETICGGLSKTNVNDILKQKAADRRCFKRYPASGRISFNLLNADGHPGSVFVPGTLSDISRGGVSFDIRQSKKESARKFLGRQAVVNLYSETSGLEVAIKGRIISVYDQLFDNYLVNFKFFAPISPDQLKGFLNSEKL
ncbi:MAG: cyclic nucleotide-binding domain-containing protein [Desulfobacter sp.]|nr:MAG: cyclic nucleotide-binding domain-containing protein [Desulfobacter sp.]